MGADPLGQLAPGLQVTKSVRLLEPLGKGGMGAVWLADHLALRTRVVVKFMAAELARSEGAVARFAREAAAAAQVKSPHVVQMLDHGVTEDGVPFIVMEHLEGEDLSSRLARGGPLSAVEVDAIVGQVAKALGRAHAAGILHRDIKPENIFLTEVEGDSFVKLLDFGIAKSTENQVDSQTKTGQVVGTPYYMSPEQITGAKNLDAGADLWSLGVVAFEALTGTKPFRGETIGGLAVAIVNGPLPVPSQVAPSLPATFDAWFERACARAVDKRFRSAKELADALHRALTGKDAPPTSLSSSDPEHARPSFVHAATVPSMPKPDVGMASTGEAGSVGVSIQPAQKKVPVAWIAAAVVIVAGGGFGVVRLYGSSSASSAAPIASSAPIAATSVAPSAIATEARPVASSAPSIAPAASSAPVAAALTAPNAHRHAPHAPAASSSTAPATSAITATPSAAPTPSPTPSPPPSASGPQKREIF